MSLCKRCGRVWTAETSGGKCPYCGCVQEDGVPPNDMAGCMKYLIEQRGAEILLRPKQFYALLADILPEHKQEKALVRRVTLDSACYQEMFSARQETDARKNDCISHNIAVLESEHFMSRENAVKALTWLAVALGWNASTYADCSTPSRQPSTAASASGATPSPATTAASASDATPSPATTAASPSLWKKFTEWFSYMLRKVMDFLFLAFLWVVSLLTFSTAISSLLAGSPRSGVFLAVAGLLTLPPVHKEIRKLKKGPLISIILFVVLWVAWFIDYPFDLQDASGVSDLPDTPASAVTEIAPDATKTVPAVTETAPDETETVPDVTETTSEPERGGDVPADSPPVEDAEADGQTAIPDTQSDYLYPSDKRQITRSELRRMSREEIALVRNEIFARYGYVFENADIQAYFNEKSWYHANPLINASTFNETYMTEIERNNLDAIARYEIEQGWRFENVVKNPGMTDGPSGGSYFYPSDTRYITRQELEGKSREEISWIRNEIFARYGYTFVTEEVRNYFSRQSWYHADPNVNADTFGPENMTPIERANLETIIQYEKECGWRT